jgi:hypothetical protein
VVANFSEKECHVTVIFHKTDINGSVTAVPTRIVLPCKGLSQIALGQLGFKAGEQGILRFQSSRS